ncbi:hypothetical protein JR316_0002093 [Psilocybe cubensis]|uniref:Uncharacterized protein n=2 Tax=Psilocybe cubensis TaxID=181762 RepID=A0A8H7Y7A6_PSICU|nr:hypothetical protein JR316_0002093 [Psilocybe cubensis]KAH9485186.1 hypothetical protein JR316_0002093 [Psilocybe cubensis]
MIILDGDSGQPKNDNYPGLTLRHPQAAVTRSSSPLPDYDTSEAQHWKISETRKPRKIFDSTIWKGALYGFVMYIFLSLVIVIPILVVKARAKRNEVDWGLKPTGSLWAVEDNDLSSPIHLSPAVLTTLDDHNLCNLWNYTIFNVSRASFNLPPAGIISIRSNITYDTFTHDQISGTLSVTKSKDVSRRDVVFSVDMKSSSPEIQNRTSVPAKLAKGDFLDLQIDVVLPQNAPPIDRFFTYLPMISQQFHDFNSSSPTFNHINIEGAVRPITCKLLKASTIMVKNLASTIEGVFDVTSTISLDSVKGNFSCRAIFSDITLTRPEVAYRPTFLTIETGDSAINANITLNSLLSSTTVLPNTPSFVAKVSTFNGPLDLNVRYSNGTNPALPLQLQVQNNLAESSIFLDPIYQGRFSARTKMSQVITAESAEFNITTKTGSRPRTIIYDQKLLDVVNGWVGWGEKPVNNRRVVQSTLDVVSALSPIKLTFG